MSNQVPDLTFPQQPAPPALFPNFRARAGWNVHYFPRFATLVFLRWLFSASFEWKWVMEPEGTRPKTEIFIVDNYSLANNAHVHAKPLIVTQQGTMGWQNSTISNTLGIRTTQIPVMNSSGQVVAFQTRGQPGGEAIADLLVGRMTIDCISPEGDEAARIASAVFMALRAHKDKLKQMGFFKFDTEAIGGERLHFFTSTTRWVSVPVTVSFHLDVFVDSTVSDRDDDEGCDASGCPPRIKTTVLPAWGCDGDAEEEDEPEWTPTPRRENPCPQPPEDP